MAAPSWAPITVNSPLETFRCEWQAPALPPTIDDIDAFLAQALPAGAQVLQWTIVESHPDTRHVILEGCAVLPAKPAGA